MRDDKERLALYLPSLRGGGAERVMVTLANGFAERGHAVDLVLARREGPYQREVSGRVRVVDLGAPRVSRSLLALARYLRGARPAAMLSAMGHANVVAVAARALARTSTRLVLSEHTNVSISSLNARLWRQRAMSSLMRRTYPRADRRIAVSAGVADDLARSLGSSRSSIDVVHNPVVTDRLRRLALESPEHPWFESGEPPVILAAGRLEPAKDFATLIAAFARLRRRRRARLIILGEGSLRGSLETQVRRLGLAEDVRLPGFVHNPYAFMRASSMFVLSSAWEGFGNVLVEAMACGVPVVSTDCPSGPAEILEAGRWGRLVPVRDELAMADAMWATLVDDKSPEVTARASDFSVDLAVHDYLSALLVTEPAQEPRGGSADRS